MESTRPLMRLGISDLENLFEERSQNAAALVDLDGELAQRRGTRALALRERIRKTQKRLEIEGSGSGALSENHPADSPHWLTKQEYASSGARVALVGEQQDLLSVLSKDSATSQSTNEMGATLATAPEPAKSPAVNPVAQALPQLSLEDACRTLKIGMGDAWEKVEGARRKLVARSSPRATNGFSPIQVQNLLAEARLANDAAIVIAARRSGRL
jgi:hypothetical protein